MNKPKIYEMFNTKVREVSLVTKPAIGVSFDVVKSADGNLSTFLQKIVDMSDQDVINLIKRTNALYESDFSPNKGGNDMDAEALKMFEVLSEKVLKSVETIQDTVNGVKKDVDAIKKEKTDEDDAAKKKKALEEKEELEKKLKKSDEAAEAVTKMSETLAEIQKGLAGIATLTETVTKLSSEVETLKSAENPSNALTDEPGAGKEQTVTKSADTPSWPSFFSGK